mgnify:CR=1 FL=1
MQPFLELINDKLENEAGIIVIVVQTGGSTPRKSGARMFVPAEGPTLGTVGGGWLELEATRIARQILKEGSGARIERFGLRGRQHSNSPMICGGDVELLFQPL